MPSLGGYGDDGFGVGQGAEGFRPLNTLSVALPRHLPNPRLTCGLFRGEPAISGLDWLFTPRPGSEEHFAR